MPDNVVKAAVRVDLCLNCNTILDVLKLLMQDVHVVTLDIHRTGLLFLLVRARVVLLEVKPFYRVLKNFYYLLASVLFVLWAFGPWLVLLIINLLVNLS